MFDTMRWGYTFLATNTNLTHEERFDIMGVATEMYLCEEEDRHVVSGRYEGIVTTKRERHVIGSLSGQRFDAQLDVNGIGRISLSFLANERTEGYEPPVRPRRYDS